MFGLVHQTKATIKHVCLIFVWIDFWAEKFFLVFKRHVFPVQQTKDALLGDKGSSALQNYETFSQAALSQQSGVQLLFVDVLNDLSVMFCCVILCNSDSFEGCWMFFFLMMFSWRDGHHQYRGSWGWWQPWTILHFGILTVLFQANYPPTPWFSWRNWW